MPFDAKTEKKKLCSAIRNVLLDSKVKLIFLKLAPTTQIFNFFLENNFRLTSAFLFLFCSDLFSGVVIWHPKYSGEVVFCGCDGGDRILKFFPPRVLFSMVTSSDEDTAFLE